VPENNACYDHPTEWTFSPLPPASANIVAHPRRLFHGMEVGDIYAPKGFFSTSAAESIAEHFGESSKPVKMTIYGENGVYVAPHSEHPQEEEVLFKPETKLKCLQKKVIDGILQLIFKEMA
jgi:hypothetical protein